MEEFNNKNGDVIFCEVENGSRGWMYKNEGSTEWCQMKDKNTFIIIEDDEKIEYKRYHTI